MAFRQDVASALTALGFVLAVPVPGIAQTANNDAATVEQRVEELRPQPGEAEDAAGPDLDTPDADPAVDGAQAADTVFVLAGAVIEGAEAIPAEQLSAIYEPYLARTVDPAALNEIASAMTARYRESGYVLSRARIPAQSVETGILAIEIVEGYVAELAVEGVDEADEARARRRADPILAERPARLATMERAITLIGDLPGLVVRDSRVERLSDGPAGAHRLILSLESTAADATVYADNRGDREVGPLLAWFAGGLNDPLGQGERIEAGLYTNPVDPKELVYAEGRYIQPIGGDGTKADLLVSGSVSESGGNQDVNDLISRSRRVALGLSHPVVRTRSETLELRGEAVLAKLSEEQNETQTYEDRTRTLGARLRYVRYGLFEGTDVTADLGVTQGLGLLGASRSDDADLSLADASASFTKTTAGTSVTQAFGAGFSGLVQVTGQAADRPLLTGEEFYIGGARYGRAYGNGEVGGEHGLAGLIELRHTGAADAVGLDGYQLYGFYDLGAVWDSNTAGGYDRESLASTGAGVRVWTPGYRFYGDLQLAQPLTRRPDATDDDGPRVFLSGNARF